MGTPPAPTRQAAAALRAPPRDLCLHLLRRLSLLLAFSQPKPTHSRFQKGSLKFRKWKLQPTLSTAPPRGQPHNLLGAVVVQKASSQLPGWGWGAGT